MNYTEPKVIYTCFPGGKHKVLTMSYDDGRLEDRRLAARAGHPLRPRGG